MLMNNDVYRVWTSEKYRVAVVSPKSPLGAGAQNSLQEGQFVPQPAGHGVWRLTELPRLLRCRNADRGARAGPQATSSSSTTGQGAPGRHTLHPPAPGCLSSRRHA